MYALETKNTSSYTHVSLYVVHPPTGDLTLIHGVLEGIVLF